MRYGRLANESYSAHTRYWRGRGQQWFCNDVNKGGSPRAMLAATLYTYYAQSSRNW